MDLHKTRLLIIVIFGCTEDQTIFIQFTDRYMEKMILGFNRVSGDDEEIAQSVYDDYVRFQSGDHQAASSRSASSTQHRQVHPPVA